MKLRAFHLRQLINLKKKRKEKTIKEYARRIMDNQQIMLGGVW